MNVNKKIFNLKNKIKEKGLLATVRLVFHNWQKQIADETLTWKYRARGLANDQESLNLPSHSVEENRKRWNDYDWSRKGEEWTNDAKHEGLDPNHWKNDLINEMMMKYIKKNSIILEIGPGAGRWSISLQKIAKKLILDESNH